MTLEGSASGTSQANLTEKATGLAAVYYGTDCVRITLGDETCETERADGLGETAIREETTFTANWYADIHHRWTTPVYGPTYCAKCDKKSWGQR